MTCEYVGPANPVLTADGCIDRSSVLLLPSQCCPPSLCEINPCALMCNFIQLLPNGPLWDRHKQEAMERFSATDCNGGYCYTDDGECSSLVNFAIYSGRRFYDLIMTALYPTIREANPATAVTTQARWLERYGWQDCLGEICRDPRLGNNYICAIGECGPIFDTPQNMPPELECAVNRGIILALKRLQMQPIPSLCGINWVIEPLGAELRPYRPSCLVGDQLLPAADLHCCEGARFEICPVASRQIEACPPLQCGAAPAPDFIDAFYEDFGEPSTDGSCPPNADCSNIPEDERDYIYPGVMAAHCIALSMLPPALCETTVPIIRCIDPRGVN